MNIVKTTLLLGAMTGLLLLVGELLAGREGVTMALVVAAVMNVAAWFWSDKIVLRMYGAQPVDQAQAPELYAIVQKLAQKANIPMPRLYLLPEPALNAFATGRGPSHAAVAATAGIVAAMDSEELEGVLAHELSHVTNRDILISTIAATLAGAITYLAHMAQWAAFFGGGRSSDDEGPSPIAMIVMAILAPIAAMLVQLAISRAREFQADASGARLEGRARPLAQALEKLDMAARQIPMDANPSTAHLFIVNPLSGRALMRLFSTHPPTEERIARLRAMRLG